MVRTERTRSVKFLIIKDARPSREALLRRAVWLAPTELVLCTRFLANCAIVGRGWERPSWVAWVDVCTQGSEILCSTQEGGHSPRPQGTVEAPLWPCTWWGPENTQRRGAWWGQAPCGGVTVPLLCMASHRALQWALEGGGSE